MNEFRSLSLKQVTSLFLIVLVATATGLTLKQDEEKGIIEVLQEGGSKTIVTQHARADFRPYLHPIVAPDGKGVVTEYQPGHHKHQTGLYWGYTRLNGRDYFHNPGGDYWKRKAVDVIKNSGDVVSWRTIYALLDDAGNEVLEETQEWVMKAENGEYTLDLVWKGKAEEAVTIGKYDYGGLFLRMPWRKGMEGSAVNSSRLKNQEAEGKRDVWIDVGMKVTGRDDQAHIAIMDHPKNGGFPQPWRVDQQLGVGPVRARLGDWKIAKGKTEVIRHRVVVYTGELDTQGLRESWKNYTGQAQTWALWGLAQREGREAEFLAPEKAVEAMTVPKGFEVQAYAAEPTITQPMAFCWDDRGRLWIAENRDYESRGGGFSNSGDSRILILEDTDRDGKADKKTVFVEGIAFPAAIAVGFDGLWLGAPPNLLFLPDKNGDDKADMDDIEVRLTGWGIRDRHETLNSFHWGPDGWLYGCQGFATPSRVGKPKGEGRIYRHKDPFPKKIDFDGEPVDINGGVWRYHPTKDRFEVVAHGFSNPWGIDYDAKGNFFITACVIPHMFHVIPGGIYHRQGGRHFSPYVYEDIRTIVDHTHRSAHGGARIYLSDAFPEEHHGRLFMCNLHEHAVLSDVLVPSGSGFVASHGDDFVKANNAQWIGFSMELGPDGALYALDWHDADICGKDVLNKDTGRVFRISPKKSLAKDWEGRYGDLSKLSDQQLVELQTSRSSWHARRARLILQHRAHEGGIDQGTLSYLAGVLSGEDNEEVKLRYLWTAYVVKVLSKDVLLKMSRTGVEESLRAWAVEFLFEDQDVNEEAIRQLSEMAMNEESPMVRLKLASALQRMPLESRWKLAEALLSHGGDADDHNIPKMIWFGVEPLVPLDPGKALQLAAISKLPLVSEFIVRRTVDANATSKLVDALGTMEVSEAVLKGMRDGLNGRRDLKAPKGWGKLYVKLEARGGEIARLAAQISQQFGVSSASDLLLKAALNSKEEVGERRDAIRALAARQDEKLVAAIPALIADTNVRIEAIRAVAAFDRKEFGRLLLKRYPKFTTAEKLEVVQTLASRPDYGWQLTQAIKKKEVPRRDVPSYVARQLRRVVGNGFMEVWGLVDELPGKKAAAYKKFRELLKPEIIAKGDRKKGKLLFERSCMACHKLHGEGGQLGPDITGANRSSLDYLLGNILDPSGVIQDDYKMVMITMRDGRTLAGNVVSEDERQVKIRIVGQEVTLAKSEIQSREVSPVSMMPEGILNTLKDEEVVDLFSYLQAMEPLKGR